MKRFLRVDISHPICPVRENMWLTCHISNSNGEQRSCIMLYCIMDSIFSCPCQNYRVVQFTPSILGQINYYELVEVTCREFENSYNQTRHFAAVFSPPTFSR